MNIIPVENLSAIVAYKPKEIQVNKGVYDRVPYTHKDVFEKVLVQAREFYDKTVLDIKAKGEKPNAHTIKADSVSKFVNPFLTSLSLSTAIVRNKVAADIKPFTNVNTDKVKAVENTYNLTKEDLEVAKDFYSNNTGVKELSVEEEISEAIEECTAESEALPDFNEPMDFGDIFNPENEVSFNNENDSVSSDFGLEDVSVPDVIDEAMNPSSLTPTTIDPLYMFDSDVTVEVAPLDDSQEDEVSETDGFDFSTF